MRPDFTRVILALLLATCIAQAIFASVPAIDIWVSAWFFDSELGFWARDVPELALVRRILGKSVWVVGLAALFLAVVSWRGGKRYRQGARPWALVVLSLIFGPGLIVNGILKRFWGRARPAEIAEFGGTATFSPAFQIVDQCPSNCSFSSGEAASISMVVILALVLVWPGASRRIRALLAGVLVPLGLFGCGLRIAMGRHYLSDTVFSILLSAFVVALLYRALGIGRTDPGDLAADMAAALRDARAFAAEALRVAHRRLVLRKPEPAQGSAAFEPPDLGQPAGPVAIDRQCVGKP